MEFINEAINWVRNMRFNRGLLGEWIGSSEIIEGVKHINMPFEYILYIILLGIVGYLIGSLNFGIVLSKAKYKDDIREHGSGNAGATNMLRVYGKGAAALTFVLDILKAIIVTYAGLIIGGESCGYIVGFCCIIGHVFPLYFHFKGGKGVACTAAVVAILSPVAAGVCLIIFVLTVVFTQYVSLGSIFAACLVPVFVNSTYYGPTVVPPPAVAIVPVLIAILIVYKHKSNIKRIMNKTENKISFGKKRPGDKEGKDDYNG